MIHALLLLLLAAYEEDIDKAIKETEQGLTDLQNQIIELEANLSNLREETDKLLLRKKNLEEYKSITEHKFNVKKVVSKNKRIADYYQATAWMTIAGKRTRIIVNVGVCSKFKGDKNSKEVRETAEAKIKAVMLKKVPTLLLKPLFLKEVA